ncbi:hypothetical protein [Amaricoccus solimangrovi]|uniref:hypothetical protein n=1 Tax=Amaricoccus solimangrovi TaxID=2589815 RepID=UPI0015E389A4|nr:hypothetical protein [Amaricoccus solimangrovi]
MNHRIFSALALAIAASALSPLAASAQGTQVAGFEPIARNSTMGAMAEALLNSIATTSTTNTTSSTSNTGSGCGCGK